MCILKSGMGVILSNGEKLIVVNDMLINENVCINLNSYKNYNNTYNSHLNIEKVYKHVSDKFNVINYGYMYGILKDIEKSELLFNYDKYIIKLLDYSYEIGEKEYVCTSLNEAIETYNNIVKEVLKYKDKFPLNSCILVSDDIGYKATIVTSDSKHLEYSGRVDTYISVIMKKVG